LLCLARAHAAVLTINARQAPANGERSSKPLARRCGEDGFVDLECSCADRSRSPSAVRTLLPACKDPHSPPMSPVPSGSALLSVGPVRYMCLANERDRVTASATRHTGPAPQNVAISTPSKSCPGASPGGCIYPGRIDLFISALVFLLLGLPAASL